MPDKLPDDHELLARAKSRDLSALGDLLKRQQPETLAFIKSICPTSLQAVIDYDDILSRTYFSAFRAFEGFEHKGSESFKRWLFTIARNCLIDEIRKHAASSARVHRESELEGSDSRSIFLLEQLAVYRRTPSQSAASHELIAQIEKALSELPKDYNTVLRFRFLEDRSVKETADTMGRSEAAITMLCQRGLTKLRSLLKA